MAYYFSSAILITHLIISSTPLNAASNANDETFALTTTELDQTLTQVIQHHKLSSDLKQGRDLPDINSPKAQLGKQLFFQPRLTEHTTLACASCHNPLTSGTQHLALATGLPFNDKPTLTPDYFFHRGVSLLPVRNASTTFNTALLDKHLFYDGRVASIAQAQHKNGAQGGIITPYSYPERDEKAGKNLVHAACHLALVRRSQITKGQPAEVLAPSLCNIIINEQLPPEQLSFSTAYTERKDNWLDDFRQAFQAPGGLANTLLLEKNITDALSAYIRSQTFVGSPWQAYIAGDQQAISTTAKQGALLFFRGAEQGGFNCVACHQGDAFTDEAFHHTLTPAISMPRPFRSAPEELDYGRWFITMQDEDKFRFRTPSLLNVAETGPWGHNGAWTTLSAAVRHMLDPFKAIGDYPTHELFQRGLAADHLKESTQEMLRYNVDIPAQKFSQKEVNALVAFLYTLTDPCIKEAACMAPWVIEGDAIKAGDS